MQHAVVVILQAAGLSAAAVSILLFIRVWRLVKRMLPGRRAEGGSTAERMREADPEIFRCLRAAVVLLAAGVVCSAAGGLAALL